MSTTVIELENKDIVVKMSGRGPIGPRGLQGEPGPAGPSEWGVITGNISDQTDLQNALDAKANVGASYTKSEDDALLAQKANADSVYTKTETDALLADKADTDDVYSKTDVTALLSGKADADAVYTKTETDTLLDAKADVGDSYTKAEEDTLLNAKANSADVYTKTETDTLLADKADADDVYTKDDVDDALADKADSADVYTKDETDALLADKAPVILSNASGSIASFSDGSASPVTALSVSIEPVQDLHGYDNPWPAGGGKNLFNKDSFTAMDDVYLDATTGQLKAGAANKAAVIPLTAGTYTISYKVLNLSQRVGVFDHYPAVGDVPSAFISILSNTLKGTITAPTGTAYIFLQYNNTAHNPQTYTNQQILDGLQLESGSSATSYAPYSNICPISGHTSAVVTRTGKNLCKGKIQSATIATGGQILSNASGDIHFGAVKAGKTYTATTDESVLVFAFYKNLPALNSQSYNGSRSVITGKTFTAPIDGYVAFRSTPGFSQPQLELSSTASSYEPYQAQQVTIDLDGTRYGGELNVLTGEMTVDRMFIELDGTETGWTKYSTQTCFNQSLAIGTLQESNPIKGICSHVKSINGDIDTRYLAHVNQYKGLEFRKLIDYWGLPDNEVSTWTAYLATQKTAGTPIQVVAYLQTPLTVQLSPSTMQTLLGQNHLWSDTGDTSVTYRADTKLFIQKSLQSQSNALKLMLTPNVETEMVASQNYALGSIVIVNNDFLKLTSAVASGANLVIGSNCVKTTMAEWVASLMA